LWAWWTVLWWEHRVKLLANGILHELLAWKA
jgi:hypothetical protein